MSLENFLLAEAADATGVRRESVDGHDYAMAGATPEHGRLTAAVLAELRAALRGRCTVRDGSVAVHIAAMLVSHKTRRIEIFRRATSWQCEVAGAGDMVTIHGARLGVDAIYDD